MFSLNELAGGWVQTLALALQATFDPGLQQNYPKIKKDPQPGQRFGRLYNQKNLTLKNYWDASV